MYFHIAYILDFNYQQLHLQEARFKYKNVSFLIFRVIRPITTAAFRTTVMEPNHCHMHFFTGKNKIKSKIETLCVDVVFS